MSGFATTAAFSRSGRVPHRPVYWRQAVAALFQLKNDEEFSSEAARAFGAAMEGDDGEQAFRAFLGEAGAGALLALRPDLPAALDDHDTLAALPEGSLGRAYLALAAEDQISVQSLTSGGRNLPVKLQYSPDPLRAWLRERGTARHDLLHVLTGYGRDGAGETALIAFSHGLEPRLLWRVTFALALFGVPKRKLGRLLPYFYRAWKRGQRARLPAATPWEDLLPHPIAEVQEQLLIDPASVAHPQGIWRGDRDPSGWAPSPAAA